MAYETHGWEIKLDQRDFMLGPIRESTYYLLNLQEQFDPQEEKALMAGETVHKRGNDGDRLRYRAKPCRVFI